ncbi:hypothetical protein D3C80_2157440 [compost metagenome]
MHWHRAVMARELSLFLLPATTMVPLIIPQIVILLFWLWEPRACVTNVKLPLVAIKKQVGVATSAVSWMSLRQEY